MAHKMISGKPEDRAEPAGARRQLLERILASRYFRHAETQSAVVRYLVESSSGQAAPPKEYDIAVNAMQRSQSFDPKFDPVVRVTVSNIRERLRMYFLSEGRREPFHLIIPKGAYRAVFLDAASDRSPAASESYRYRALESFWQPHLTSEAGNALVYTEPLFFRDDLGHYYRDPEINEVRSADRFLKRRGDVLKFGPLRLSLGCLWTGEVHCMLALLRLFQGLGAPLEIKTPRTCSWLELKRTSLILLGNARTNSVLKSLDGGTPFTLQARQIENRKPANDEKRSYRDSRFIDGNMECMTAYALVTRRPGPTPESVVTMIAANHCRGIEGAGYFLSQEERVREVLERLRTRGPALPRCFQLVLRVDTIDTTREVVNAECVAHRVFARNGQAAPVRKKSAGSPRRSLDERA